MPSDPYSAPDKYGTPPTPGTGLQSEEVSVDSLLATWHSYRHAQETAGVFAAHDCGHLYSGYNFESSVVGYAGVNVLCKNPTDSGDSGGINMVPFSPFSCFFIWTPFRFLSLLSFKQPLCSVLVEYL